MGNAKYIGRVGALAVALGVGNVRRTATRMTVTIGVAVLVVMATVVRVPVSTVSPPVRLSADSTALIMGGGTVSTPDDYLVEVIKNQYIEPTHPGQDNEYVPVTTPMEAWPITGVVRLLGIAFGPPEVWGPGGAGWWPDEPWWKLTGLFDPTLDQAVQIGVSNLEQAMVEHGNDHLVIYGISEGSLIATAEKRKLAEQYPAGTVAPDIDFVMQGTFNLPNGGLHARFPGLHLPIGWTFDGPAPTDTQFDTVMINRQYDGIADFPLYPLNLVADLNALLGTVYVHTYSWDVSLPPDPTTSPAYQGTHGDTSYYFFPTEELPLFGPLRTLGVPEKYIDVVEPVFKVIVELGYDRSIPPWQPTPARLIPMHDPATVATDLVNALGEGITNAKALTGSAPLLTIPAPGSSADTNGGGVVGSPDKVVDLNAVGDGIVNSLSAFNPLSTDQGHKQVGTDGENSGPQTALGRWRKLTPKSLTDGFKFTPLKPRSSNRNNRTGGPVATVGANIGDSLQQAGQDVDKTIKKATDSVTKGFSGFKGHTVDSKD